VTVIPVGFIELRDGHAAFRPILDLRPFVLAGALGLPAGLFAAARSRRRARSPRRAPPVAARALAVHSHSMVAGGFDEMSRATRFTPGISLMIRPEITSRTS
jgi:hypothetical protein